MSPRPKLFVTCDTPPVPPFVGHNRKIAELMRALCDVYEIHAFAYTTRGISRATIDDHWSGTPISWTTQPVRHGVGVVMRSVMHRWSLPTARRDFTAEADWIRKNAAGPAPARLLIDFISGAPLLARIGGAGTILSGHDCMSYLFAQERCYARRARARIHLWVRERFAKNTERSYAHLAERVHVVSEQDAAELRKVNGRIRTAVIPLASSRPAAVLRPFSQRAQNVIWGNLGSDLIRDGLERLLAELPPGALTDWLVVGRLTEETARKSLPKLALSGCRYEAKVEDMSTLLARTRVLCLPDVGGTGQKTRTLDGLAHGCCVIGLEEVFRGVGLPTDRAYRQAASYRELATLVNGPVPDASELSAGALRLFEREFTLESLRSRWIALIESCGHLPSHH